MKSIYLSLLLLSACSSLNVQSRHDSPQMRDVPYQARSTDGDVRKRLLVLPFIDGTPRKSDAVADSARQALLFTLQRSDQFVLVNANELGVDLSRLRTDEEYDLSALSKAVSAQGISAIVEGKVLDVRARKLSDEVGLMRTVKAQVDANVRLRIWGVRNDKELLNQIRQAQTESNTTRFAKAAGPERDLTQDPKLVSEVVAKAFQGATLDIMQAIRKITWEGRIATVKGEKIYINAGHLSGLQVGDLLRVVGENEDVFDPETGALIGRVPGHIKGTIEVVSYFSQDGAVARVHSGAGFRENDRVEMY